MNKHATVECPWCQQSLTIPPEAFGQRVSCTSCSGKFVADMPLLLQTAPQFLSEEHRDVARESTQPPDRSAAGPLLAAGIGGLLVSGLMGYWGFYEPLEKMRQHASKVSYSGKVIVFFPCFAVWSLAIIVAAIVVSLRKKSRRLARAPRQPWVNELSTGGTFLGWLAVAAALAPGFWLLFWFEDQVEKHGYRNGFLTAPPQPNSVPDRAREIDPIMTKNRSFSRVLEDAKEQLEARMELEKQLTEKPAKKP